MPSTAWDWSRARLKQRLQKIPRLRFIVGALVLFLIGRWVTENVHLADVSAFCDSFVHTLGLVQPFNLVGVYYNHLLDIPDFITSGWMYLLLPFIAWWGTALELWAMTDLTGHILILLALLAGIWPTAVLAGKLTENPFYELALVCVLVPLVAGLMALGLQWLLIALFFVFGQVVGLIVLFLTTFGAAFAFLTQSWGWVRHIEDSAGKIEATTTIASAVLAPQASQPAPRIDDPDHDATG
jgi:hypothetical protein